MNIYMERDADRGILAGKTIAVAGYGNQGRPQALNLRDSGCAVIVGAREGGRGWRRAQEDGFAVATVAEAVRRADILMMLLPDEVQGEVYNDEIRGALRPGAALCFAHGFSVAFGGIEGEKFDLLLVAPKGQGERLRETYLEGSGLPCFVGVEHDASGDAKRIALAVAGALGCLRIGAYETSFREEAVSDIFGEQAVLCGGVSALMKRAFDVLVKKGHSPEVAYFECFHEVKIIVDLFSRLGLSGMRDVISGTAAYGSLKFGEDLIGDDVEKRMEKLYERIESGAFAKIWLDENRTGCKEFLKLREKERGLLIEKVGTEVRARSETSRGSRGRAKKGS
ncbi:MAG: ketol-acid reductoisomerase [Candidatus Krumholzibacteriia bacterium]